MEKLTPLQKAVSDLGYDIHKYDYLAKEGHVKMQKQVVKIKSGTRKDPVYTEETLLAHNGLAVRKYAKGRYTITHVRTGYGIRNAVTLSYRQARDFVVQAAIGFNWDRDLEEITKDATFVPFVVEMYRKVQGQ